MREIKFHAKKEESYGKTTFKARLIAARGLNEPGMENESSIEEVVSHEEEASKREPTARSFVAADTKARALYLLVGALGIGFAFWWLQYSTQSICCGDFDAYYHFKWSRMLWEGMRAGHFPPSFDALPLTTLNPKDYVDHHLLFHIFQIPFTWFSDMRAGAKIGTWLFASLAVFSCYWLVVRHRLRYPLVWLIAILACSTPFLYRMNMGKAMSVSIVMLVVGIELLFARRYMWLLPLAFIFALTYDMVFLLWVAAGVWLVVILWSEGFDTGVTGASASLGKRLSGLLKLPRSVWWAVGACGLVFAGTILGYVINPYFPHNLQLVYEHFVIKVRSGDFPTRVGNEWYSYESWDFLGNCLLAFAAMVCGYVAFNGADRRGTQRSLFFLIFSTFLLIVNARWRRFSEYWPPFAILFAAFALQPLFDGARASIGRLPSDVLDELQPFLDTAQRPAVAATERRDRRLEFAMATIVAGILGVLLFVNIKITAKDIAGMAGPDHYRGGMEWISQNVPRGELIFNTDWDDFPKMFYYDPTHPVVSGLDPNYLLDQDRKRAELFEKVSAGQNLSDEEVNNMGAIIRDNFCLGEGENKRCARYVFTDNEHQDFYNNALDSGWFDVAYEDKECTVLRIRDTRGDPPPDKEEDKSDDANDEGADNEGGSEP